MDWIHEYSEIVPADAKAIVVAKEETEKEFMTELHLWSQVFLTLPAGLVSAASVVKPNKCRVVIRAAEVRHRTETYKPSAFYIFVCIFSKAGFHSFQL